MGQPSLELPPGLGEIGPQSGHVTGTDPGQPVLMDGLKVQCGNSERH